MLERLEGGQLQCLCCHRTTDMSLRFYKKKTANIMFECSCNAQPGIREAVEALYHTLQIRHIDVFRMIFERFKSTLLGMQHTMEQQQRLFRLLRLCKCAMLYRGGTFLHHYRTTTPIGSIFDLGYSNPGSFYV